MICYDAGPVVLSKGIQVWFLPIVMGAPDSDVGFFSFVDKERSLLAHLGWQLKGNMELDPFGASEVVVDRDPEHVFIVPDLRVYGQLEAAEALAADGVILSKHRDLLGLNLGPDNSPKLPGVLRTVLAVRVQP